MQYHLNMAHTTSMNPKGCDIGDPSTTLEETNENDLKEVQDRYHAERDKRWRLDGPTQYTGLDDDSVRRKIYRDVASDQKVEQGIRMLIVGAGFGGLLFAVRLLQSGFLRATEILFVDQAGGFGGTWWWNQYPGLVCDVESYIYMPLLEETKYMPSHKYLPGPELKAHAERIANHWRLSERAVFTTKVNQLVWNDEEGGWTARITQDGKSPSTIQSEFVILATGLLDSPKIPKLDGLETYKGKVFHTSRWDYSYTGGSPSCPQMDRLRDKTIGFVRTGASAVQAIPHLAQWAKKVVVFQRTPSAVDHRNNCPTDPDWWQTNIDTRQTGWQRERMENFNAFVSNECPLPEINLVGDQWIKMVSFSALIGGPLAHEPDYAAKMHQMDSCRQNLLRRRVKETVNNPETVRNLQPWYPGWCKRPCFSDNFLATFNRPNVVLVDTNGKGVKDVTENGILFGDREFDLDAIIFGTGYSPGGGADRGSIPITGRGGQTLQQKRLNGMASFHGVCTNGVPNLFLLGPYQAGASANQVYVLDQLACHVAYIISEGGKAYSRSPNESHTNSRLSPLQMQRKSGP